MTTSILDEAERYVSRLAIRLTMPAPGECLCCFVDRQLALSPCDGTFRYALRFRDATAPRATAMLERLRQIGAHRCDCELFLRGYRRAPDVEDVPCAGVRRGSVQPCRNWARKRGRR